MVLALFSCSESNTSPEVEQYLSSGTLQGGEPQESLLEKAQQLEITIPDSIPSMLHSFQVFDSSIFCLSYKTPSCIYVIDNNKLTVRKYFKFENRGVNFRISQYSIGVDEVAIVSESGVIISYNWNKEDYNIYRTLEPRQYPSDHGPVVPFIMAPPLFFISDSGYVFNVYPLGYFDNYSASENKNSPHFANYNKYTNTTTYFGKPMGIMSELGSSLYSTDLSFPYLTRTDSTDFLSYPMSHLIYYGQNFDKKIVIAYPDTEVPRPLTFKDYSDPITRDKFRRTTPYYSKLNLHENLGKISRLFYQPNELIEVRGRFEMEYGGIDILTYDPKLKRIVGLDHIQIDENMLAFIPYGDDFVQIKSYPNEEGKILLQVYSFDI